MSEREVARMREEALSGGAAGEVRTPVRASWLRARRRGLAADGYVPPVPLGATEVAARQRDHPLATVWPEIQAGMSGANRETGGLLFVSDANGHLLWVAGATPAMQVAERVHLVPGALWSDHAAGTSGVGMALALGRPFQVVGAEHYLSAATGYTCTAAPIHDPVTGEVLGSVDHTCPSGTAGPMSMSLVRSVARLAESHLHTEYLARVAETRERYAHRLSTRLGGHAALVDATGVVAHASPLGWLPPRIAPVTEHTQVLEDGRPVTVEPLAVGGPYLVIADGAAEDYGRLEVLGRHRGRLTLSGATHELSPRHSEIVTLLLGHHDGFSAAELCRAVYGNHGKLTTIRGELARLRALLGPRLRAEPYRITGEFTVDFRELEQELRNPDTSVGRLLDDYPGPLLPRSTAPGVHRIRSRLHERLGNRVLSSGDPDAVARWRSLSATLAPWIDLDSALRDDEV
ncbi:hypothetical protein RIF23_08500 [Lipingzhangella sp. LS1_29]|uniref:GAF domain-containing protein n=1 Tax=Lipingzhangella rawalii TaxID=2055835 RepID=A0ABU2H4W1_9ACTN|nr:GAF domain-containing protein [Lipingzhangella rawalii]MDS1270333.1 hypothetical protein [Lipingzhangella rawalii]